MTKSASQSGREGRRKLPPEHWDLIRASAFARARDLRVQTLRALVGWLTSRPAAILRQWSRVLSARRAHRSAVRELQALDNRTLRDMGIARSEIEYLVAGGDSERRVPRRAVARRAPCAAPDAAGSRDVTANRRAA